MKAMACRAEQCRLGKCVLIRFAGHAYTLELDFTHSWGSGLYKAHVQSQPLPREGRRAGSSSSQPRRAAWGPEELVCF